MNVEPMRDAYSGMSQEYIGLHSHCGGDAVDEAFIRQHLEGLGGPVLDLGCGPGQWTAFLHASGVEATGIDLVPEFIAYAGAMHPEARFRLGSMTDLDAADESAAGILAWYSTIHLPPPDLNRVLIEFRRLVATGGILVVGFFDSDDDVAAFDHRVITAYRWPADVFAERLSAAGFNEVHRLRQQSAQRSDRKYAAIAARAS